MLNATEARIIGVMIEKALTVPGSYPMTLNTLVGGCNQRSCRDPVVAWTEDRVQHALDALRHKGLAKEIRLSSDRVAKYKHTLRESLGLTHEQQAIIAELLLRGPQSVGSLRTNASRMVTLESIETVEALLASLTTRDAAQAAPSEPLTNAAVAGMATMALVCEHPAPAGSRAKLYSQLISPGLHAIASAAPRVAGNADDAGDDPRASASGDGHATAALESRVSELETRVADLERVVQQIKQIALG